MAQIGSSGISPEQLQALVALIPTPATAIPPDVADTGARGAESLYARADHTHASRARRARMQCSADGTLTWTFNPPFPDGTIPRVQAIVETAVGVTDIVNVQIEGQPTATQAAIRVNRGARQGGALGIPGGSIVLTIQPTPGVFWVHLAAFEG